MGKFIVITIGFLVLAASTLTWIGFAIGDPGYRPYIIVANIVMCLWWVWGALGPIKEWWKTK